MEQQVRNHEVEAGVRAWRWPETEAAGAPGHVDSKARFHLYPPVKVTLLEDPEAELDCLLTDISLTDIKFLAEESLPEDEIIAIELEDSFLLADVRYSRMRKDKFTIGAARMHALQKRAAPPEATKIEMLEALIGDFHAQCASQIEKIQDAIHNLQVQPRKEAPRRQPATAAVTRPVGPAGLTAGASTRPTPALRPEPAPAPVIVSEPIRANPAAPFEVAYSRATAQALREILDLLRVDR